MRRLGTTVARLTAARRAALTPQSAGESRLSAMSGFGSNPGALDAFTFRPADLPARAPLVVVLHGCTQNAAVYDHGSGWSTLADRHGFALLFPQQRRANNPNLCFNWYAAADARRGRGEARSMAQMIAHMTAAHDLDAKRVFITGLSAGGAMTAVMLASYPELFAAGAIIAGLPYATADTLPAALERMRGQGGPSRRELAELARSAAPQVRPVPSVSVWHGTSDSIVSPVNADAIVGQWRDLHDQGEGSGMIDRVDGHRRETWHDRDGRAVVTRYDIRGMGHGTPLDGASKEACGTVGPHMLDANICSTSRIAESWGITRGGIVQDRASATPAPAAVVPVPRSAVRSPARPGTRRSHSAGSVNAVIEDALRAAGLMR